MVQFSFHKLSPIIRERLHVTARIVVGVFGAYAFSASLVALMSVALPRLSTMPRSEAVLLASMLGFVIYLIAVICVFAASRLWLVCTLFATSAVGSYLLILALKRFTGAT
jgi:hypothetical protein